ncbi:MAG: nicotinamide riboside transporter PnuC, partial [Paramuribaculum sp.]|nr:nicotinamide riboside transporter PnuC [Paramuribaculum sp.]
IAVGYILDRFTDSTVPWADGFTTALSIVAMWMLARKYVEQWIVWIAADIACAILYAYKGLWFTGSLYLVYAVIAVFGYSKWKRLMGDK